MLRSTIGNRLGPGLVLAAMALLSADCGQSSGGGSSGTGGAGGTIGSGSGGTTASDAASGSGGQGGGSGGAAGSTATSNGGNGGSGGFSGSGGVGTGGGGSSVAGATGGAGGMFGSGGRSAAGGTIGSGGGTGRFDASNDAGDAGPADARPDLSTNDVPPRETIGTGGSAAGGTGGPGTGGGGRGGTGGGGTGGVGAGGSTASITLWLAGDSTVANGSTPCPAGWGKSFQSLFNSKVTVVNSAQGGRSVQTWLYDVSTTMGSNGECTLSSTTYLSAWTNMLTNMKTGDYLFIQFGINDGDGSCNRHVGTALFQTYYGMMAQAARDRGANPIFVTPVSSISCSGNKAVGTRGGYATATEQAGVTYSVPVIDLEQLSVALYTSLGFCPLPGPDNSTTFASGEIGAFFCEDHTHFEAAGATQIAGLVAKALRDQGIGLAGYLK